MGYNKSEEKPKQKPKSKPKHRKGLWSPDEDMRLRSYILQHGHGCWSSVPINAGLQRNGKSCRLRWINYLRPGLKRGTFTVQEEGTIIFLHDMFGNKWSQIAQHLPGRTDNEIKNYWHSYLKKRASSKVEVVMDSQAKIENYNSPPESIESSLSPKKPESQSPNLNSYENTEGSSTDTDQIFLQSSFPRILFAEWLPVDHVYGKKMDSSAVCSLPKENLDHSSQFQDDFVDELNGGAFGDGFNGWLTNASAYEIFSSQFHQQDIGNDFMESIASDEICSQFNIINDEMYLQADFRN